MKKENCPFCGHRWIRKSSESIVQCPNCKTEYLIEPRYEETQESEIIQEEEPYTDEFDESNI